MTGSLPSDAASRKAVPLASGLFDYFPDALIAVASLSHVANEQHHPGEPLHWDRNKSTDHDDCLLRHFVARGTVDTDGVRHRTKVAWRALAALQEEVEAIQAETRLVALFSKKAPWKAAAPETGCHQLYNETSAVAATQDAKAAPAELIAESQRVRMYDGGIPAESAYLASFGPNTDIPEKAPKGDRRIATAEELERLRSALTAEQLRTYGICNAQSRHPAHAEALRDHDERLYGAEDRL